MIAVAARRSRRMAAAPPDLGRIARLDRVPCQWGVILLDSDAVGGPEARMVPFFIQIKCHLGNPTSGELARRRRDRLRNLFDRRDYDLLVKFYVEDGTDIGHFVNEKVQTIPGIQTRAPSSLQGVLSVTPARRALASRARFKPSRRSRHNTNSRPPPRSRRDDTRLVGTSPNIT